MILAIFAIEQESGKRVFRAHNSMSLSKISYYITEFNTKLHNDANILECETHNFVHFSNNGMCFAAMTTKDEPVQRILDSLQYIDKHSSRDMFDILYTIDNLFINDLLLSLDLTEIKQMDSQDEKIHNMMLKNKEIERQRREKERKRVVNTEVKEEVREVRTVPVKQPARTESSTQPILIILKEKLRVIVDKEGYIKENCLSGEVNMVLFDQTYKNAQLRFKNVPADSKSNPYLDKNLVRRGIFRFEKPRDINKSIPVLKWSGKVKELPVLLECWTDEEEERHVHVIELKAKRDCRNIKIVFSKEGMSDIWLSEGLTELHEGIEWNIQTMSRRESISCEIKCVGFDINGIFPAEVSVSSQEVELKMEVDGVLLEGKEISNYEVRKVMEVEKYTVVNE